MASLRAASWPWARSRGRWILWDLRRRCRALYRRMGLLAVVLPTSAVGCVVALAFSLAQEHSQSEARSQLKNRMSTTTALPARDDPLVLSRTRMAEFQALLPEHDDIPDTLADLFDIAKRQNVSIRRGEYKALPDATGGFMRYQMALPATGEPIAVVSFMAEAMRQHRTLTVESVRLSRSQADARQVEARIQWVLLTQLPKIGTRSLSVRQLATRAIDGASR